MKLLRRQADAHRRTTKIFCIGRNKTGTKSLAAFFQANGFKVGDQETAEGFVEDWARGDFRRLIPYCRTADFFQDMPFSLPGTFRALDEAFPHSRFILSVRSSAEEWYDSYVRFHIKAFSSTGAAPSEADLGNAMYRGKHKGFALSLQKWIYGYPATPLYDKAAYTEHYERHNRAVIEYFRSRPEDLLVLNLAEGDAFERLCKFAGLDPAKAAPLPHLNRSA